MHLFGRISGGLGIVVMGALYVFGCMAPVEPEATAEPGATTPAEGPVGQAAEALAGTCHGNVTCPNPKSCGSWTDSYICGSQCVLSRRCSGCDPHEPCMLDVTELQTLYESSRSCTLQNGSVCTEYLAVLSPPGQCGC